MTAVKPETTSTTAGPQFEAAVVRPTNFLFGAVPSRPVALPHTTPTAPPLGPLVNFTGTFSGNGFNTIFRPQSTASPAKLPTPAGGDNVLELNLTSETLSFSESLGTVPNRGMVQADIMLNGVPYLQTISDVTDPSNPVGIHVEPGLWMAVPSTGDPGEGQTVVRMGSIPHGTTIIAQGTSATTSGGPVFPAIDITPFFNPSGPKNIFPSQKATNPGTARIPQDLTSFIAAGTITQAMLDNPNSVLQNHITGQKIVSTTTISVSTNATSPLFGGGAANIAFLLGDAAALTNPQPAGPNAQTLLMEATFWIETVEHTIVLPPVHAGQTPQIVKPETQIAGLPTPRFLVNPTTAIRVPRPIVVTSKQIQYSQTVFLNFNGLTWPHVSVATLVPSSPITVPPSAWS